MMTALATTQATDKLLQASVFTLADVGEPISPVERTGLACATSGASVGPSLRDAYADHRR